MKSSLLRVVVVGGHLAPDPAGRLPGRGAHVHPDPRCVDLAEKRRAFPRALRLAGPLDVTPVRSHVVSLAEAPSESPVAQLNPPTREQVEQPDEHSLDEHSMSRST